MKLRAILLFIMILYDASLHWAEILGKEVLHPLYPTFPLWGFISYNLFWTIYWTFGVILMLTLLGSGVTVKHKTIIQNLLPLKEPKPIEIIEDTKKETMKNVI